MQFQSRHTDMIDLSFLFQQINVIPYKHSDCNPPLIHWWGYCNLSIKTSGFINIKLSSIRRRPALRQKLPRPQWNKLVFKLLEWALEPPRLDLSFQKVLLVNTRWCSKRMCWDVTTIFNGHFYTEIWTSPL